MNAINIKRAVFIPSEARFPLGTRPYGKRNGSKEKYRQKLTSLANNVTSLTNTYVYLVCERMVQKI